MELIPGLPYDIARDCLIRVEYKQLATVVSICKSWKSETESPEFRRLRRAACTGQKLVVMVKARVNPDQASNIMKNGVSPVYRFALLEPDTGDWCELPPIPGFSNGLPLFCQVASVGSDLVVLGGLDPVTWEVSVSVFIFNFVSATSQKPPTTTHTAAPSAAGDTEGDSTDKAWAEQLASLKKGTSLAPPPQTDSRNRTIRQVAAGASPAVSSASSIGGTDAADDELSPALTPDLRAGDVSDMLEPARAGPSILRLTSPSNDSAAKKPRPQKEFQSAETKKQRQNRQKIEDRRLEREAAEKDRQAKLEAQRRTAREARGEPARNGIAVSKPPTTNAWAQQTAANATQTPVVAASNTQLLDTFEPDADSTSSSTGALNNSTAATSTTSNFENELPSEEDQMRMVSQMDGGGSGWSTVSVGKKKQKKTDPVADDQRNDEVPKASIKRERPAPAQRVKQNGFAYLDDQVSQFNAGSHPDDSQWGA